MMPHPNPDEIKRAAWAYARDLGDADITGAIIRLGDRFCDSLSQDYLDTAMELLNALTGLTDRAHPNAARALIAKAITHSALYSSRSSEVNATLELLEPWLAD